MFSHKPIIMIRGGGDLATGVIQKFHRAGFLVFVLETAQPTTIRRTVALSDAVHNNEYTVEDMTAQKISAPSQAKDCWKEGKIPILIDPMASSIAEIKPLAVVDAIIAKRNLGTNRNMAPITVGLGPGFTAKEDVDVVIETMRGHNLGRLIFDGSALPNTNTPGEIGGRSVERVVHAPVAGVLKQQSAIGDVVQESETILTIDNTPVFAPFTGLLRGLIQDGLYVKQGLKIADIDPRTDVDWHTISDKARCLGGAALEAVLLLERSL